jgi:WXXGXW repeat (2 copies)
MKMRRILSALMLTLSVATAPACVVTGTARMRGTVAYSEPPPPQQEVVQRRDGYIWIQGRWDYQDGQWVWINGRWEQERQGYVYNEGQWVQRGSSWHWVEGNWVSNEAATGNGGVGVSTSERYDDGYGRAEPSRRPIEVNDASNSNGGVAVSTSGGGRVVSQPAPPSGMYPTAPPPPPRVENRGNARSGYLWVNGRWDWRGGGWEWIDGHWEHERANQTWTPGRWELQGNYYVWIEGSWR